MKVPSCVRSGYCCEMSPCDFGHWDLLYQRCSHLEYDLDGRTRCGIYDEILKYPERQKWNPAFGFGCCSSMNGKRKPIIREYHSGKIPMVEVDDF